MAKGRKLTITRSERFLESFGYDQIQGTGAASAASELGEDEIWSMVDDAVTENDLASNGDWSARASVESNGSFISSYRPPRTHRQRHRQVGGLSLAFDDDSSNAPSTTIVHQYRAQEGGAVESPRGRRHMATSAPLNVPDWSKIYRVDSVESMHESDEGVNEDEPELVPPHEYLAREYARSRKMVANSVFEGVGRTLKGRDMSRVRDAVWSQTGFDG